MKAWLVNNYFYNPRSFVEATKRFVRAFRRHGVGYSVYTNADCLAIPRDLPDFVLMRDKDMPLIESLERLGMPVYNDSSSIRLTDDKALTYVALKGIVPMPDTILCPYTYPNVGYVNVDFIDKVCDTLSMPMVVKATMGSFGEQVWLVRSREELEGILARTSAPLLFQRYIESSHGRDMRLYVVGDEVVAAAVRESSDGDFRSNTALGGRMTPVKPSEEICRIAVRATEALGLSFGGVDVLLGDTPMLCEVNSNALFNSLEDATGTDVAGAIVRCCMDMTRAR